MASMGKNRGERSEKKAGDVEMISRSCNLSLKVKGQT